ncbi:MAG: glycosyltransferase family 4 protein [Alphaproteobacteria bacterium]|nr:glycosyltransferase family 4 protein [Alphaproteobacteria bacterium]
MSWSIILGLGLFSCIVSYLATWAVLAMLRARSILDHANERSSHLGSVPRGGGIAVMAVIVVGWSLYAHFLGASFNVITIALLAAALAGISFIDDVRGLPTLQRLVLQTLAVALGCLVLPDEPDSLGIFQGWLPPVADRLAAGFLWLWFVNLFNFMDGIDGITVVEAGSIGLALVLMAYFAGDAAHVATPGIIVAGAVIGFGIWNWRPAKIFLGDVGSVGLGFLLGWLLLSLAGSGQWAAALLLPLYYLADATWTLLRRMLGGEDFWQAHRSHFYQHAASSMGDHGRVALIILGCNGVLVALALWSVLGGTQWVALLIGGVAVAGLLCYFSRLKSENPNQNEAE